MKIVLVTRNFLITTFAVLGAMNTKAQPAKTESNYTLTAGGGIQWLSDDLSPVSSGRFNSTSLTYSFINTNANRQKSIVVGFEKGIGTWDKNTARSNEFILQYANAFSVLINKKGRWNNYTGYSIIVNPQYIKAGDQYSWATVGSLSLYNSLVYSWKKSSISFDFSLPLAGFGSRPQMNTIYTGPVGDMLYNSINDLSFTSLHNLQAVYLSFQYQKIITGRLSCMAVLHYSYKELSINKSFLQQAYRLQAGLSYGLE